MARISLSEMDFSGRALECFKRLNIKTVEDLVRADESAMLKQPNFGQGTLEKVKKILGLHGLVMLGHDIQVKAEFIVGHPHDGTWRYQYMNLTVPGDFVRNNDIDGYVSIQGEQQFTQMLIDDKVEFEFIYLRHWEILVEKETSSQMLDIESIDGKEIQDELQNEIEPCPTVVHETAV